MRVQFDLRPAGVLEKERKRTSFNLTRVLVLLLMMAFFAISILYIVQMTTKLVTFKSGIEDAQAEIDTLGTEKTQLETEIAGLKKREAVYVDALKIMQEDLPTLEVMNAVENNMTDGMKAESINFTPSRADGLPGQAVFNGSAYKEDDIVALTDGLSTTDVFSGVSMPTSKKDDKTGRVDFTLNLGLRPIGQIKPQSKSSN